MDSRDIMVQYLHMDKQDQAKHLLCLANSNSQNFMASYQELLIKCLNLFKMEEILLKLKNVKS